MCWTPLCVSKHKYRQTTGGKDEPSIAYMRDISILSAVDSLHVIYSIWHNYSDWLKTQILHTLNFDSSSHVYLRYLLNNAKYVLDILVPLNFLLLQNYDVCIDCRYLSIK